MAGTSKSTEIPDPAREQALIYCPRLPRVGEGAFVTPTHPASLIPT